MGADRDSCSWLLKDKLQLRIFRFGFRVYDDANEYTFQFARFFFSRRPIYLPEQIRNHRAIPASIRPNAVIVRADVTRDRKKAVFVNRDRGREGNFHVSGILETSKRAALGRLGTACDSSILPSPQFGRDSSIDKPTTLSVDSCITIL